MYANFKMNRPLKWYVYVVLCVHLGVCLAIQYNFGQDVYQIAVDNMSGDVYIGGNNVVYHLTQNLTPIGNTSLALCNQSCQNQVKVLEVDYNFRRLLVCGSANRGQCEFLDLDNVSKTEDLALATDHQAEIDVEESKTPMVHFVSYPSFVMLNTSRIVVASPNSQRQLKTIVNPTDARSKPVLSVREVWNVSGNFNMRYVSANRESPFDQMLLRKHNRSFHFDFLDGFCHGEECFFLTLQQVSEDDPTLITRVGSVCSDSFFPYIEIPMDECKKAGGGTEGDTYDRALAMTVGQVQIGNGKVEQVVIFVFGKSSNPIRERIDSEKGFAICTFSLDELVKEVNNTKIFCSAATPFAQLPDWFYGSSGACRNETAQEGRCSYSSNMVIQRKRGEYGMRSQTVIPGGRDVGSVISVFTHTERVNEKKTKSNMSRALDDRMTIYVALSSGRIHKVHAEWVERGKVEMTQLNEEPLDILPAGRKGRTPRRDFAVSSQHYYMLIGTNVVRRPLDYCLDIDTCLQCSDVPGCAWCSSTRTCQLEAKCPGESCPPEIKSIKPMSGPKEGGTVLTIQGTSLSPYKAYVQICQQNCTMNQNAVEQDSIRCTVPALTGNTSEKSCSVTVHQMTYSTTAEDVFQYKTPSVKSFHPMKMLRQESGDVSFYGHNLDIGSHASVTFGDGTECKMNPHRKENKLKCHLHSPKTPVTREKCYEVVVSIDQARLHLPDNQTFCRSQDPNVTGIHPTWTFVGGGVPVTVRGRNLNVVNKVHLGIAVQQPDKNTTSKTDDMTCEACSDDSCIVCCSPDITDLVTSTSGGNASGSVYFNMTSRDEKNVSYGQVDNLVVQLLPDPEFWFGGTKGPSCLQTPNRKTLKIAGKNIPHKSWVQVRIGHQNCTVLTSTPTSLTCGLQETMSAIAGTNESHPRRRRQRNSQTVSLYENNSYPDEIRRSPCRRRARDLADLPEGTYRIAIFIRGRRFFSACIVLSESAITAGTPQKLKATLLYTVVGAVAGIILLVLLTVVCCLYVRHAKRRQFERRYQEQGSGASGASLIPSPIGSAENTYVSLAHLLNPKHDKKKKREIHEKGLLIQRKYLTLGSVIGHGNFGCVYEGYLQRRSSGSNTSDDDQRVAVKTLLDPVTHAIDLQGFINEALLMKDFDHDHVLGLLGLSEGDRGLPLVVLPFMPRGDLLTYVKDENMEMTVGDVLRFCTDIASGMEYLAGQKLVHRDLAARNCMLDDDLRVKVADFGLCRDVYEKGYYHSDNKKKLPIRWMAIESIEKGTYSSKSDVWSLGVVVWELTTRGITPYPGVEGWDILRYLLAGRRLDQPLLCPDPLYALMERCWDEKPIKRPPFHELKQNLESFTKALETPAATNALCLDTKIVIPRCHRFRDDAAVMEKVLMGMRKLEMKQAAASLTKDRLSTNDQLPTTDLLPAKDRRSTKKRRSPRADRPDTTAATSIPEITVTQAEGVTVKSSVNGGAKPEHLESLEMQDRNQSRKDDSYFVLEK